MEANPIIPLNLNPKIIEAGRLAVLRLLKPGDAYSFILPEPIKHEHPTNENEVLNLEVGDTFVRKLLDDNVYRLFVIRRIHEHHNEWVYETEYLGVHKSPPHYD